MIQSPFLLFAIALFSFNLSYAQSSYKVDAFFTESAGLKYSSTNTKVLQGQIAKDVDVDLEVLIGGLSNVERSIQIRSGARVFIELPVQD